MKDWKVSVVVTDRLLVPTNFAKHCARCKKHKTKRLSITDSLLFFRAISIALAVFDFRKLIQELILIYYMKNTTL